MVHLSEGPCVGEREDLFFTWVHIRLELVAIFWDVKPGEHCSSRMSLMVAAAALAKPRSELSRSPGQPLVAGGARLSWPAAWALLCP